MNKLTSLRFKSLLIFFSFFLLVNCGDVKKKETIVEKPDSPSLYINMANEDVNLVNYKGKRILLNFWATWCTPCLQEMPSLVRAQEILQDDNYVFLFPTTDEISKIEEFNNSKKYPLNFLHLTSTLDQLNIYALPATFLYNSGGEMVKRIDGATEWDSEEIINLLKTIQ